MGISAQQIQRALKDLADPTIAEHTQRFFKTGKGEYGEGDKFLGIRVPVLRRRIKKFRDVSLNEALSVLRSSFHEERLFALLLLVEKFSRGVEKERGAIYELYLSNTRYINNWDLVDSSAPYIVGSYLADRAKQPLYVLARSDNLWERRIAIVATFHLIRRDEFEDALAISQILLDDAEDLIHKAVGWMLREIGKRNVMIEKTFLKKHYRKMPRTMLRYAIERFSEEERKRYLQGTE